MAQSNRGTRISQREREEAMAKGQDSMYHIEHWLAWLAAGVAIALGTLGLLRGFGIIGDEVDATALDAAGGISDTLADGLVLLLPAITFSLLALSMHRNEHHRFRYPDYKPENAQALWAGEHFLSMIAGLAAIGLAVAGILVGFDVFDRGNSQLDGALYSLASIGSGVLSNALHSVAHHQVATDEDYLVQLVEFRVRESMPEGSGVASQPGYQRGVERR
jgi:hypothetical protein